MTKPAFEVSALTDADADAYNRFLMAGVLAHPDTLRISPSDIVANPFKTAHGLEGSTFAARDAVGQWLGVVSVEREAGREKRRHIAWVLRMYVSAEAAGAGVGRALLERAISRARELPGVGKLSLTVAAHNERAVGLYRSAGFNEFSREDDAFRDPTPRTELTMSLRLY
jgi:ribosomal protein S18 acetylase RimI-like enzyme